MQQFGTLNVYGDLFEIPLDLENKSSENEPAPGSSQSLLAGFDLKDAGKATSINNIKNIGTLGGEFTSVGDIDLVEDKESGIVVAKFMKGALVLEGKNVPESLSWNGSFTVGNLGEKPENR